MTLEELKAEAKKQGYRLTKIKKYQSLKRCNCGNRPVLWNSDCPKGFFYWCENCDTKSPIATGASQAKKLWNQMFGGES